MRPKFSSTAAPTSITSTNKHRRRWLAVSGLCLVLGGHQLSSALLGVSYLWNDPLLIGDDSLLLHPRSRTTSSSRRSDSRQEPRIDVLEERDQLWTTTGGSTRKSSSSSLRRPSSDSHTFNQIKEESTMAACLLVMDDNHWLIEWLAYHYHVLPLRSLIVVQDPHSKTSPQPVLDRWKRRMNITVWKDSQFLKPWVLRQYKLGQMEQFRLHRYRQQFFYPACLKALQTQKHPPSWVLLVDTDELVRPNPYYPWSTKHEGSPSTMISPYDMMEPGSVMKALRDYEQQSGQHSACLHIPRLQMSSRIETDEAALSALSSSVPTAFNASHFLTSSWFYHGGKPISTGHDHLDGKNIVQVQRVSNRDIPLKTESVHYVIPKVCPVKVAIDETPLLIHHYLGTLEQFTSRHDPREAIPNRPSRNAQLYHSYPGLVRDTTVLPWLTGFVQQVGDAEAQRLLQGVGVVQTTKS